MSPVARKEAVGNAFKMLVGKPKGKIPHKILRRVWEDNIRT